MVKVKVFESTRSYHKVLLPTSPAFCTMGVLVGITVGSGATWLEPVEVGRSSLLVFMRASTGSIILTTVTCYCLFDRDDELRTEERWWMSMNEMVVGENRSKVAHREAELFS